MECWYDFENQISQKCFRLYLSNGSFFVKIDYKTNTTSIYLNPLHNKKILEINNTSSITPQNFENKIKIYLPFI